MQRIIRNDVFIGVMLALVAFAVYLRTLAPTVDFIDSGELAAVAATLGIAHPSGYPLFTLIGYVFAHLPLGLRTVYQLNIMSAVLCSAAVYWYYRLFAFVLSADVQSVFALPGGSGARAAKMVNGDGQHTRLAAAVGTMVLAFSETYWSQALSIEVYSLHILFLALTILLFTRAIHTHSTAKTVDAPQSRLIWWYGFAFVLGLSFTNHMTTILLAPAFLYLYFATHGFARESWVNVVRAVVPFLVGFSVNLYLPLRAAQEPALNWGNPATLERFWWHFTGKQYRVWIFSSFESATKQFTYFLESFPGEFAYIPLLFGALGLVFLFRNAKRMFRFTFILFLSCVLYSINYDIHDIDSYFLLAYVVVALWIAIGVSRVFRKISNNSLRTAIGAVLVGMPLYVHYENVDESRNFVVEDYAYNMFASLEQHAIVLSYQWDYFVSAAYYYQQVEGLRTDVVILDKELFRRSWYFHQLERQYPWLIERSRTEVDAFLQELYKFEHGIPYNPVVIQRRFEAMIISFAEKNIGERPVYVTQEIEPEFTRGFQRIPEGLAFRLVREIPGQPVKRMTYAIRDITKNNKYTDAVRSLYALSYTNQAISAYLSQERELAFEFVSKALTIKPDYAAARNLLEELRRQ